MDRIESDLWEAWLTAGACRRAARKDLARADFWNGQAAIYTERAVLLLEWDAVGWRWPQMTEPG